MGGEGEVPKNMLINVVTRGSDHFRRCLPWMSRSSADNIKHLIQLRFVFVRGERFVTVARGHYVYSCFQ